MTTVKHGTNYYRLKMSRKRSSNQNYSNQILCSYIKSWNLQICIITENKVSDSALKQQLTLVSDSTSLKQRTRAALYDNGY